MVGNGAIHQIFRDATAAIPPEYSLLPIPGADPVYREGVYCYELYLQRRRLWPAESPYRLNGELDKRSHPYFQEAEVECTGMEFGSIKNVRAHLFAKGKPLDL